MRQQPFYYASVWYSATGSVIGQLIDLEEYMYLCKRGYSLHSFTGRKATVCVLSSDPSMSRDQKLDFAIMFMKGTYVTIEFNLKELTANITNGTPPPCH